MALAGDVKILLKANTKSAIQSLNHFRKTLHNSFNGSETKNLDQSIKQTEKTTKQLETSIEKTKAKLQELLQSSTPPKSVIVMEKELAQLEKQLVKMDSDFKKLSKEQADLAKRQIPGLTLKQSLPPEQYARFQELDALIIKNGEDTDKLNSRISELKGEQESFNTNAKAGNAIFSPLTKTLTRIQGLIKRVFVFSVMTAGLRSMRKALGDIISQNSVLSNSLTQIRSNLLVAFAPIIQTIVPWLQTLLNLLAKVTAYIAAFTSMLFGKSVNASKAAAKALNAQAAATKKTGKASKDAAKDTEKATFAFDELNTLDTKKDSGTSAGGEGGANSGISPFDPTDLKLGDELEKKLQAVFTLVGLIGGALLLWKLTSFITDLMSSNEKLKLFQSSFGKLLGITSLVAGAILLIKGYTDAWVNGIDWDNFAETLGGILLFTTGIALVLNPVAAGFALMGEGIALIVLGIKDIIENGPTLQNILTIISGIVLFILGLLTAMGKLNFFKQTLPILMMISGALLTVKGVSDAWVNGINWKNFAEILGGIALTVTGAAMLFGKLGAGITLVIGGIAMMVTGIKDFIKNGYSMKSVLMILAGFIATVIGVLLIFNATLLANPITWIVIAIAALVAAFVILWNECEGFRNFWIKLWEGVKNTASKAITWGKDIVNGLVEGIGSIAGKIKDWCNKYIVQPFKKCFGIHSPSTVFKDFGINLIQGLINGIDSLKDTVINWFKDRWDNIKDVFSTVNTWFGDKFSAAWDAIKEAFSKVKTWFKDKFDDISDVFSNIKDSFKTWFENAWKAIKGVFDNWGTFFGGLWDTVKTKFTDFGTKLGDAVGGAVRSGINKVIEWIQKTINNGIKLINGAIDLINNIPGVTVKHIETITLPTIPQLAKGAVLPANKPFLAMVGDQKHGTNIEAPLSTIKQAVAEVINMRELSALLKQSFAHIIYYMRQMINTVISILKDITALIQKIIINQTQLSHSTTLDNANTSVNTTLNFEQILSKLSRIETLHNLSNQLHLKQLDLVEGKIIPMTQEFMRVINAYENQKHNDLQLLDAHLQNGISAVVSAIKSTDKGDTIVSLKLNEREFGNAVLNAAALEKARKGNSFIKTNVSFV